MVKINLLPDARKTKLRDQNNRQLAISVAGVTVGACVAAMVLLVLFVGAQKIQIGLLTNSIKNKQNQIQSDIPEAQSIATFQAHLTSLNTLHNNQTYLSRFFTVFNGVATNDVAISSLSLDAANKLTATGQARTYAAASKLAQAMEAYNVTIGTNASATNAPYFTDVLLNALSGSAGSVGFSITANVATGVNHGNK